MSEYQYYEFVAVDGPISDEGLQYARNCSSRAEVSRFRWQNEYHFGDFHGSVETLLKYYDVHFYIANWGTVRLGLAFPAGSLTLEAVEPYLRGGEHYEETLTAKKIGDRLIVWWERNEEGGGGWTDGGGALDQLIGIREELLRGDHRRSSSDGWPISNRTSGRIPKTAPWSCHRSREDSIASAPRCFESATRGVPLC